MNLKKQMQEVWRRFPLLENQTKLVFQPQGDALNESLILIKI